jgi:hypothetical protein
MLAQRAYNSLQNITAKFAFGDWLYDVSRKLRAEKRFELEFKSLSLQLL